MIGFEYLLRILLTGLCCFIAVRLRWIYQRHRYHLFWQSAGARQYIFIALLLAFAAVALVAMGRPSVYLFPMAITFYLLCALAAVKISERGIFANGFMARWLDIVKVQRAPEKNQYLVITNRGWRRLRFEVPAEFDLQFRKMLALQRIPLVQDDQTAASPSASSDNIAIAN
jgi:hypothetical protein